MMLLIDKNHHEYKSSRERERVKRSDRECFPDLRDGVLSVIFDRVRVTSSSSQRLSRIVSSAKRKMDSVLGLTKDRIFHRMSFLQVCHDYLSCHGCLLLRVRHGRSWNKSYGETTGRSLVWNERME